MFVRRAALAWTVNLLLCGALAAQPTAPQNLLVTAPADETAQGRLELRWDPVPGAFGYEVLQLRGKRWVLDEDDPSRTPITSSTILSGLTPGAEYQFCIRAISGQGKSQSSVAVKARTHGSGALAEAPLPARTNAPLPLPAEPASRPEPPPRTVDSRPDPAPEVIPPSSTISDLVPPPPRPKAAPEKAKLPPPPAPEGMMSFFAGDGKVRLSWRQVREATGYLVEEEKDGRWVTLDEGIINENRPSVILKGYLGAGPYYFRVRATREGSRSEPSYPSRLVR